MLTRILGDFSLFQSSLCTIAKNLFAECEDYSQDRLIEKINIYLEQRNRRLLEKGYCHGMTLQWLKRMAQGREEEYYTTIRKIIDCADDKLGTLAADIEKIRRGLDKKQNPDRHYFYCVHHVDQMNVDAILKTVKQRRLDGSYTRVELVELLLDEVMNGNMLCISSKYPSEQKGVNHSIGLFKRDDRFYVYDCNSQSGKARSSADQDDVVDYMLNCLYQNFDIEQPEQIDLEIKLITDGRKNRKRFAPGLECECLSKRTRQIYL